MYDVACTLVHHLKVLCQKCINILCDIVLYLSSLMASGDEGKLAEMTFAVPAFRAYAHNPSCQVSFMTYSASMSVNMHVWWHVVLCFTSDIHVH